MQMRRPDAVEVRPRPQSLSRTYRLARPLRTHWRRASCEEVRCPNFLNGFMVHKEALTGQQQSALEHSGRPFQMLPKAEGETYYVFAAGTPCLRHNSHRVQNDRPELYLVQHGLRPVERRESDGWINDSGEHLERVRRWMEER